MAIESAREKFIDWLSNKMTLAGRGDNEQTSENQPSGKFWLGRIQSSEAVAENDWGDLGERLEPCAIGLRLKPSKIGPWSINIITKAKAWMWNKDDKLWKKTDTAETTLTIDIPKEVGVYHYGKDDISSSLKKITGKDVLEARIDVEVSTGQDQLPELTISFVNTSPKEHSDPILKDTRLYECELRICNLSVQPFLLETLEDSFRYDRRVNAYGINCGVRFENGEFVTEDAIKVDKHRPTYWNSGDTPPNLKFLDLNKDPITPAKQLLASLRQWGSENWSPRVLDQRQIDEGWDRAMRNKADVAAKEFEQECNRIEHGISLLESDTLILQSFKGMNFAMSHSSRGKYDSWRPFQYGFLLANLPSITDQVSETNTVDVVWFATGGGKTETYLGLLITAALYDRLTGKKSGITAWSRFPLRMLSLQQTQRFADALGGAEITRRQLGIKGAPFSLGFFVGQGATPNRIVEDPKQGEPDPDDPDMPKQYQVLEYCPFCHQHSIKMAFNRKLWKLEHQCTNNDCTWQNEGLPVYVVDEEIYRYLPTIIVGTLDKAASISMQASMRGLVGAPSGVCSKEGHGYTYAIRSARPHGCLVPGCRGSSEPLPMDSKRYGPSYRLQDELHLLRDSLGAVDSHYEALYDSLQEELCDRKPKILASSATLTGYEKQVDVLYRRSARVFPVPPPKPGSGFWTSDSNDLMRRYVAIAPKGVTIEYTVDRLLTELQTALRDLSDDPVKICGEIGVDPKYSDDLLSLYGTDVVYGNTLRDLEAVMRSAETQVQAIGPINTASLTGKTDFYEVRNILERLQTPETDFHERLHIITASSMMSHGVDVDRLNIMVMLGLPLSAAEFIQATARVGRRYPSLVFVVHKIGRERDAGIFRSFKQFIEQGDRFVEPIPVTRRSRRVLERTVSGLEFSRILMVHEALAQVPLTTIRAFREYVNKKNIDLDIELKALIKMLQLDSELDEPLRNDLISWFEGFQRHIDIPPADARFLSDLSPTEPPMRSLRDVDKQVPVIGSRIQ